MPLVVRIAIALIVLISGPSAFAADDLFQTLSQSQGVESIPPTSELPPADVIDAQVQTPVVPAADGQSPVQPAAHTEDASAPPLPLASSGAAAEQGSAAEETRPADTLVADDTPLALKPPQAKPAYPSQSLMGGLPPMVAVGSSLAIVLGLFFVFVWATRRTTPHGSRALPSEVVETLGRVKLAQRQQIYLLRCGRKLLLVSVTPAGVETLTEVTDPDEVAHLSGLCRQSQPGSSSVAFRQVFSQMSSESAEFDRYAESPSRYYSRGYGALEDRDV